MDVKIINEKQMEIQKQILRLLKDFEEETECFVQDVSLIKTEESHKHFGMISRVQDVSLEISL